MLKAAGLAAFFVRYVRGERQEGPHARTILVKLSRPVTAAVSRRRGD
jgi:hypothetical protein